MNIFRQGNHNNNHKVNPDAVRLVFPLQGYQSPLHRLLQSMDELPCAQSLACMRALAIRRMSAPKEEKKRLTKKRVETRKSLPFTHARQRSDNVLTFSPSNLDYKLDRD
jgi:hypothetical protein